MIFHRLLKPLSPDIKKTLVDSSSLPNLNSFNLDYLGI